GPRPLGGRGGRRPRPAGREDRRGGPLRPPPQKRPPGRGRRPPPGAREKPPPANGSPTPGPPPPAPLPARDARPPLPPPPGRPDAAAGRRLGDRRGGAVGRHGLRPQGPLALRPPGRALAARAARHVVGLESPGPDGERARGRRESEGPPRGCREGARAARPGR